MSESNRFDGYTIGEIIANYGVAQRLRGAAREEGNDILHKIWLDDCKDIEAYFEKRLGITVEYRYDVYSHDEDIA